jgi:hypothetical protein
MRSEYGGGEAQIFWSGPNRSYQHRIADVQAEFSTEELSLMMTNICAMHGLPLAL